LQCGTEPKQPPAAPQDRGDRLGRVERVAVGEALVEPDAFDQAGARAPEVVHGRAAAERHAEVAQRARDFDSSEALGSDLHPLIFFAGANLGAAAYEYGLARLTRAFLVRG
jgi:hypothetical protein